MRRMIAIAVLLSCNHKDEEPTTTATASLPQGPGVTITSPRLSDAGSAEQCASTRKALDDLILSMPATCEKDQDCGGFYLHDADLCGGPTMLHVPGCPPFLKPKLFELHNQLRNYCPAPPTCEPRDYRAVCRLGRCVDANARD